MKPSALALTRLLGALALTASTAFAQGGLFRGAGGLPQPPGSTTGAGGSGPTPQNQGRSTPAERESAPRPGSVPAILFSEERWEFWWEFNHDAYVNLRPSLLNAPASAAFPKFTPFDADSRGRVLVPALIELLRDRDEVVRSAAVLGLARLQDPSVLPYLA